MKKSVSMEIVNPHAAGIDVGSRSHFVAIGQNSEDIKEFGVYNEDLQTIAQWLRENEVETVAMESTGTYWQSLYASLQESGFQVILCNGKFTKNIKGRKSDVQQKQQIDMKYFFLLLLFFGHTLFAQSNISDCRTQINFDERYINQLNKHIISETDSNRIFKSETNNSSLFYYSLVPQKTIKAVLVLIPSTLEETESVLNNNKKLCQLACDNNIMVIVPSTNAHICLDKPVLEFLNKTFSDVIKQYNVPRDKFIIGGFSLGGIVSLRYTEIAHENQSKTTIVPCMAFSVDGPVDFITMYRQFENEIKKNINQGAVAEAEYYIQGMHDIFGGSPDEAYLNYVNNSIYSRSEADGGNAKHLRQIPLRIYSDPDIDWALKNRQRDVYDMNVPDHTALIVELQLQGNQDAEFVNCLEKVIAWMGQDTRILGV